MPLFRKKPRASLELIESAIKYAKGDPQVINAFSEEVQPTLMKVAKALTAATVPTEEMTKAQYTQGMSPKQGAIASQALARRAAALLSPDVSVIPDDINTALHLQGLDWVEPFAPGPPLQPFYGYDRRPRQQNYAIGRNITTEPRDSRIPYGTLRMVIEGYDIAMICIDHMVADLTSMELRFSPLEGVTDDVSAEIAEAKRFWRKPDGYHYFNRWLTAFAQDVFGYDCGTLYKMRKNGKVTGLKLVDGSLIAPMLDYFGDIPESPAPAFQQFIQGLPWDLLTQDDLIYQPYWPQTNSPYGKAPIERVLLNANTDVRLQWYFLQFFTAGAVPEAFATAPPDMSDPDALAEFQETWNAWAYGNQEERYGLRFLPAGTEITQYKPQQFDPQIAEYVMRRTVSAFRLMPQDLGFTDQVNRASGDTQMDSQFRISSLPNVSYFEDILNDVTQNDLGLRVEIRFDTGREKEDRLMEAQAHQIYVSIGAESPDEVRDKVLNLPVDPTSKIPRFYAGKAGLVPLSAIVSVSGNVDPETGAPKLSEIEPAQFVWPGQQQPDPSLHQAVSQTSQSNTPNGKTPPSLPNGSSAPETSGDNVTKTEGFIAKTQIQGDGLAGLDIEDDIRTQIELKAFKNFVQKRLKEGRWRDFEFHYLDSRLAEKVNDLGREILAKEEIGPQNNNSLEETDETEEHNAPWWSPVGVDGNAVAVKADGDADPKGQGHTAT